MTKEDEEKAAAEKAKADADAAAAKAKEEADKGPTPEERAAADERRNTEAAAQKAKIEEQEARIAALDTKIKAMKDQQADAAKKGKNTEELEGRLADSERRLVDQEKTLLEMHEREKTAIERANSKTLETDLRATLDGKLVDSDAMQAALDLLILRKKARVDSDGKVAVIDEKGNWGSLSAEAVLKHIPAALQAARGPSGSGQRGPTGEIVSGDAWQKGKQSQADFNRLVDEGKLPSGEGRRAKAQ